MANGKEVEEGNLPEPNFIEQANALIDAKYKESESLKDPKDRPGLQISDHKLWVAVMDMHITHVYDVLIKGFREEVAEHYAPIMRAINSVSKDLEIMKTTNASDHKSIMVILKDLTDWQKEAKEKFTKEEIEIKLIKERLALKKERIDRLEKSIKKKEDEILIRIKAIDDEIHGEVPIKLFKAYALEKWILGFILAVLVSSLITFFSIRKHSKNVQNTGTNGNVKIENTK